MQFKISYPLQMDRQALLPTTEARWETHTSEYETPNNNNTDGDPDAHAQFLRDCENAFIEQQH